MPHYPRTHVAVPLFRLVIQTRTALLGFLHSKAFFADVSKLTSGVRPGSGVAVPGLVVESVVGLLTQVSGQSTGNESSKKNDGS